MTMNKLFARWQANFLTGLAIVFPAAITIAVVVWLFGTISNFTDALLVFVPRRITHQQGGLGPMHWYWSLIAFLLTIFLIGLMGVLARHYIVKKLIKLVDFIFLRVPLLNKIYSATKAINRAFSTNDKSSFKQVVLIEFPREGLYSVGFLTNHKHPEIQDKTAEESRIVSVVIPTTPNPTTGFLVMVRHDELIQLDMSVAEGIKLLISLGTMVPHYTRKSIRSLPLKKTRVTGLAPTSEEGNPV